MDLFNKKKTEQYERELCGMKEDIDALRKENHILKQKISGERTCSGYCSACKNKIVETHYSFGTGTYNTYTCILDCKCKDFQKAE